MSEYTPTIIDRLIRDDYDDEKASAALERGRRLRHVANGFEAELIDALEWVTQQSRIIYESWKAASNAADSYEARARTVTVEKVDRWLAEVKREAAAQALEDAANEFDRSIDAGVFGYRPPTLGEVRAGIMMRAAEIREGREQ